MSNIYRSVFHLPSIFRRELASYAQAHRDKVNELLHIVGNPILFVAVVLPLNLLPLTIFGIHASAATVLVIPALALWVAFDVGIGLAIIASAIALLFVAAAICNHLSVTSLWALAFGMFIVGWALQIVGHQMFEHKRPSLLDNPLHMLISPMFIFAKLFVYFGLRPDLAAIIRMPFEQTSANSVTHVKSQTSGRH